MWLGKSFFPTKAFFRHPVAKLNILKAICGGVLRNRGRHLVPFIDTREKLGWKWPLYIRITSPLIPDSGESSACKYIQFDRSYRRQGKNKGIIRDGKSVYSAKSPLIKRVIKNIFPRRRKFPCEKKIYIFIGKGGKRFFSSVLY